MAEVRPERASTWQNRERFPEPFGRIVGTGKKKGRAVGSPLMI